MDCLENAYISIIYLHVHLWITITVYTYYTDCFNGHFPGNPGFASGSCPHDSQPALQSSLSSRDQPKTHQFTPCFQSRQARLSTGISDYSPPTYIDYHSRRFWRSFIRHQLVSFVLFAYVFLENVGKWHEWHQLMLFIDVFVLVTG